VCGSARGCVRHCERQYVGSAVQCAAVYGSVRQFAAVCGSVHTTYQFIVTYCDGACAIVCNDPLRLLNKKLYKFKRKSNLPQVPCPNQVAPFYTIGIVDTLQCEVGQFGLGRWTDVTRCNCRSGRWRGEETSQLLCLMTALYSLTVMGTF
jgi:hypothetical protein